MKKIKVPTHWEKWDVLRAFGTSRLVQSTVVIPVIGYLILFSAELAQYFQLVIDSEADLGTSANDIPFRLYFLYLGFCALAVGSLIFSLRCPPQIKAHPGAYDFVDKQIRTTSNGLIKRMNREVQLPELTRIDDLVKASVMTDYFVFLKVSRPRSRRAVFLCYAAGVALLALPTLHIFYLVMASFIQKLIGS